MEVRELLINHYKTWRDTTNNKKHADYASTMLDAVYRNDYKRAFAELGARGTTWYDTNTKKTYPSTKEAAKAFGVQYYTLEKNYEEYGLIKIRKGNGR
jgi:hypothetical protein